MRFRLATALVLTLSCALAAAQTRVYESKDKTGPVFSDQPSPGARELTLPAANVMQGNAPAPQQAAPPQGLPVYRLLNILSPESKGTVHSNTGAFDVRVQAAPELRAGDRIRVRLDGNLIGRDFQSTAISLTDADWQAAASSSNIEHTLQVAIVDKDGKLLIESSPVSFYARRTTAGQGRR